MIIWLTGLSSSGKSTIAEELATHFKKIKIIDGDELRKTISKNLGYSKEDREENVRRATRLANEYENQKYVVIVALMSPYRQVRNEARARSKEFIEVFVKCPVKVCQKRDVNKVYERFEKGEIQNVNGLDLPYEEPENPEIIVETNKETVKESVAKILKNIKKLSNTKERRTAFPKHNLQFYIRKGTNDRNILNYVSSAYGLNFKGTMIVIGAHIGGFSCFAVRRGAKKVYSYEPNSSNFDLLVKNIKINKLNNTIFPRKMAVSSKKEIRLLYMPAPQINTGRLGFYYKHADDCESERVQCNTLESIFKDEKIKSCDLIKLDCEGAEYEILFNTPDYLFSKIKNIILEAHRGDVEGLIAFLEEKGFKVEHTTKGVPTGLRMLFATNLKYKKT